MKIRLMHDWVLAEVESAPDTTAGGIVIVGPQPIRMATVISVGPGRRDAKGKLTPTQLKAGDKFPFFKAASETRQGHALAMLLDDNQVLIKESDVLFVDEQGVSVTL